MMCQWFFTSQFYEGVLDLVLVCASRLDPNNVGFHYYKNKEPAEDREGYEAYIKRYFATREQCLHSICCTNRSS
jgi:nuclear pore complex protein Nup155